MFGYDIDAKFIIAQVIGFVAMFFGIASFQLRQRSKILWMQTASNLIWALQYLLLGSYSAVLANTVATARNVIYCYRGKIKLAESAIVPIVSSALLVTCGFMTYTTPFDILPISAMVVSSIAFFVKDEQLIRYLSIFVALPWLIFGIYAGSIAGILSDGISFISIIVAIFRYRSIKKYDRINTDGI